jgi:glycosyltransferase involved in cell wall biosynthesis
MVLARTRSVSAAREERPLRVLAVMASLMGGGAERQMSLFLRNADRARVELTLCLLVRSGEFLDDVPDDVPVVGLGKRSAADAPALVARLARVMRTHAPDVVYAKVDYANTIAAMAAAVGRCRAPLVLGEESVQSRALAYMNVAPLRRELLRWSYKRAARVVTPSPGVADDLRGPLRIPAGLLEVIPNMVEVETIRRASREPVELPFARGEVPLVVSAGRLQPMKGQVDLVEAIELLNRRRPVNLLIIGDGPDRPRVEARVADLRIGDRVALPGFVANPFAAMAQADVFVSPSHFESFGNVLVEAMAVGAPIVSTRVPAGPEWLVRDGENGLFAQAHDPADLAARIEDLLDDPLRAQSLAARGRATAREYDVAGVVPRYEELFDAVARGR